MSMNKSDGSLYNDSLSNGSIQNTSVPNGISTNGGRPDMFVANIVLIVTGIIQIVGIIGNGVVVVRVATDRKLHTVTFVILAALAVSDGIALCSYLTASVIRQSQPTITAVLAVLALCNASFFSSAFHVLYISIVRYLILIHPLKTITYLKTKRMIGISVLIYIFSGVIAGIDIIIDDTLEYTAIMWTLYYVPLIIMICLHGVKYYHLKNNRLKQSSIDNSATIKTMTKIILFITLSSFLLPLPSCIVSILSFVGTRIRLEVKLVAALIFSCNNCINPFLYCFMSPKFRSSVKEGCCLICRKSFSKGPRNGSLTVTTGSTVVSSRTSSLQSNKNI